MTAPDFPVPASPEEPTTDPESYCHRCDGPNVSWAAPSPLWNAVMRQQDEWLWDEIICPTCFALLAQEAGVATSWRLTAHPIAAVPMTSPGGRVWDDETWLWRAS